MITQKLNSPDLMLYSDEENYIVCREKVGCPTWIWTKDNFDKNKLAEIIEVINLYLADGRKDKFTCKKELYDLLALTNNFNLEDYFEIGSLYCIKTKIPPKCDGNIEKATLNDTSILALYLYNFCQEVNDGEPIILDEAKQFINEFINNEKLYVWKNQNNKIVRMAKYNIINNNAKINYVYTPVEERGKNYVANLIYHLSNKLLTKKIVLYKTLITIIHLK